MTGLGSEVEINRVITIWEDSKLLMFDTFKKHLCFWWVHKRAVFCGPMDETVQTLVDFDLRQCVWLQCHHRQCWHGPLPWSEACLQALC